MASTTTASTTASTTAGVASWSESLSTSLESQQPGPSGMTLGHLQLPFRQERPEQLSMGGDQRAQEPPRTRSTLLDFQVPPSQDILRDSLLSQESLGFGGGLSQGHSEVETAGSLTLADNLLQLSEQAREVSQERQQQDSERLSRYLSQDHPRANSPPLLGEGVAVGGRRDDDDDARDAELLGQVHAADGRVCNVPSLGGTDLEDARPDTGESCGVPVMCAVVRQLIHCRGDQALPSTTATDSDVPAALAKKPSSSQKVPNLSTRSLSKLKEAERQGSNVHSDSSGVRPSPLTSAAIAPRTAACELSSDDKESLPQRLFAGPPVFGAASGESSHDPATQTTSSAPSDLDRASPQDISVESRDSSKLVSPLALQSPSPPTKKSISPEGEAVPSTLPSERMELDSSQENDTSLEDLGNQLPIWCDEASFTKKNRSRQDSSSSSCNSSMEDPPPPKRRREKSRSTSSDVPGWQKEGNSDVQVGSSGQAQPMCAPPSAPVLGSRNSPPVNVIPGRSVSEQSSGSSVLPSSSLHTGSSLGTVSSPSQSLKKTDSSLSEQFGGTSPSLSESKKKMSPTCQPNPALEKKPAVEARTSQSLESISSELFRDSLFADSSSTEELVVVDEQATEEERPAPVADRDISGVKIVATPKCLHGGKDEGVVEQDTIEDTSSSLTQLEETPEPSQDRTRRRIPAMPLRSPAKIVYEQDCTSDAASTSTSPTMDMDTDGDLSLRLRLTQSQSSQSVCAQVLQADMLSESSEVGGESVDGEKKDVNGSDVRQDSQHGDGGHGERVSGQGLEHGSSSGSQSCGDSGNRCGNDTDGSSGDGHGSGHGDGCRDGNDGGNDGGGGHGSGHGDECRDGNDGGGGHGSGHGDGCRDGNDGGGGHGSGRGGESGDERASRHGKGCGGGGREGGSGDGCGCGRGGRDGQGEDSDGDGDDIVHEKNYKTKCVVCEGVVCGRGLGEAVLCGGRRCVGVGYAGAGTREGASESTCDDEEETQVQGNSERGESKQELKQDAATAKPLYESLQYDSTEDMESASIQDATCPPNTTHPPDGTHPPQPTITIASEGGDSNASCPGISAPPPPDSVQKADSEEHIDIALINSGSFHFQLPNDSLLEPITSITPNPASSMTTPPWSAAASAASAADQLLKSAQTGIQSSTFRAGRTKSLSPSAVGKDFFTRSVTPSQQLDSAVFHSEMSCKETSCKETSCKEQDSGRGQLSEELFSETNKYEHSKSSVKVSTDANESRDSPVPQTIVPLSPTSPLRPTRSEDSTAGKMKDGNLRESFQLGLQQDTEETDVDYSSPPLLPQLNIPTDAQFELSEDMDPAHVSLNRSTASEADEGGERASKSLFSDVVATRRQKVDGRKRTAKELGDPYCFSQDSLDLDMQVIMERMRSRKKQRSDVGGERSVESDRAAPEQHAGVITKAAPQSHTDGVVAAPEPHTDGVVSAPEPHTDGIVSAPEPHTDGVVAAPESHTDGVVAAPEPHIDGVVSAPEPHTDGVVSAPGPLTHGVVEASPGRICGPLSAPSVTVSEESVKTLATKCPAKTTTTVHVRSTCEGDELARKTKDVMAPNIQNSSTISMGKEAGPSNTPTTRALSIPSLLKQTSSAGDRLSPSRLSPGISGGMRSPGISGGMRSPGISGRLSPLHSPMLSRSPGQSLSSPHPSMAASEFVSPSRTISCEGFKELKRNVDENEGGEISSHELRYVHTMCTVIEERFISSELVENGVVVSGSEKFWPESSRPYTSQEIKVELLPRVSSNTSTSSTPQHHHHPSPSIILSPFTRRYASPSGGSYSHLKVHSSSSNPFPSSGHATMGSTSSHPLPSPLSTSHRPIAPWKDTSGSTSDGGVLKLGDVPKCRREKSREDSSSALDEELKESTSAPVTPCKDVFSVTESSTSPEDAVKVKKSKGGRNARKSDGMGKKPSPGFTVKKRRTSKSAFKVGTRLSLRASPRKSVWEEKHSSFVAAAKTKNVKVKKLLFGDSVPRGRTTLQTKTPRQEVGLRTPRQGISSPSKARTPRQVGTSPGKTETPKVSASSKSKTSRLETASPSSARTPRQTAASPSKTRAPRLETATPSSSTIPRQEMVSPSKTRTPRQVVASSSKVKSSRPGLRSPNSDVTTSTTSGSGTPGSGTPGSSTAGSSTPRVGTRGSSTPSSGSGSPGSGTPGSGTPGSPIVDGSFKVGDAVIARWMTDKRWYAATVKDFKNGRVVLHFADGEKGSVASSQLFSQSLLRKNEPVTAGEDVDQNLPEVNGLFESFSQKRKLFTMQTAEGKKVTYSTSCFSISPDTAMEYVKQKKASPSSRKRMTPHALEQSPLMKRKRMASCSPGGRLSAGEDEELTIEDLISPSQHCLFQGYTFFITQKSKEDKQTDNRDEQPLNKHQISLLITNRKGRVLDSYKDERITDGRYFVLSDDCCRTQKFLMGLALAIPCVAYNWITDCIQQGIVLDYASYRLPAGIPRKGSLPIKWTPRQRSSILKGVQVYVHHHQNVFKEHWRLLLKYSGANVLTKLPTASRIKSDKEDDLDIIVVAEEGCHLPCSLSRCSGPYNVTVLGAEWVVQCLVQGRHLHRYHDFVVKLKS